MWIAYEEGLEVVEGWRAHWTKSLESKGGKNFASEMKFYREIQIQQTLMICSLKLCVLCVCVCVCV